MAPIWSIVCGFPEMLKVNSELNDFILLFHWQHVMCCLDTCFQHDEDDIEILESRFNVLHMSLCAHDQSASAQILQKLMHNIPIHIWCILHSVFHITCKKTIKIKDACMQTTFWQTNCDEACACDTDSWSTILNTPGN